MARVTMKQRREKLEAYLQELEGKKINASIISEAVAIFGGAGNVSTKVNEAGEVFCNYFGTYLPADQFKINSKGKYDSMSEEGRKLNRTQKSLVNKANSEVLSQFKQGILPASDMQALLDKIEANSKHVFAAGDTIPVDFPYSL